MTVEWTAADSTRALEVWTEYQRHHDVSSRAGQTAGIEPVSGQVWIGDSIQDVVSQRNAAGIQSPLYFARIGSSAYFRKGGHR